VFEWDDILIVGDSFSAHRSDLSHWPMLLTQQLTGEKISSGQNKFPRGKGFTGCSWWSVRKILLEELEKKVPKVLIVTHTEAQRLPSDENFGLNSGSVFRVGDSETSHIPTSVLLAAQQYYKYLSSVNFQNWAQLQWFNELDDIITAYQIPQVLHVHSFLPWKITDPLHVFKTGTTFTTPLWEICDDNKNPNSLAIFNHFNVPNNMRLAVAFKNALQDYTIGSKEITI